jgi:hypothetical protein
MSETEIAKNLLEGKNCDTCWHGNSAERNCNLLLDVVHERWLEEMRQKRQAGITYEIRDDNDYESLRRNRPEIYTCRRWEKDHPHV